MWRSLRKVRERTFIISPVWEADGRPIKLTNGKMQKHFWSTEKSITIYRDFVFEPERATDLCWVRRGKRARARSCQQPSEGGTAPFKAFGVRLGSGGMCHKASGYAKGVQYRSGDSRQDIGYTGTEWRGGSGVSSRYGSVSWMNGNFLPVFKWC